MLGKAKKYIQNQILLAKLEGLESVGQVISKVAIAVSILLFSLFLLLILNFAAAYAIATAFEETYLGFLIVAGFYLLLILLLLIFRKSIQHMIINKIISSALSKPENQVKKAREVTKVKKTTEVNRMNDSAKVVEKDNNVTIIKE